MGAAMGCAGGQEVPEPEFEQWLAPYLGTWVVKSASSYLKNGFRDRANICKYYDRFKKREVYCISFYKHGDNTVRGAYHSDLGGGVGREVGGVVGRRLAKPIRFQKSPEGDMWWDGYGSYCSVPIINIADPQKDTFTLELQMEMLESKRTIEFQRECLQGPQGPVSASEYSGRHIVSISGCAGACVDQITLHYSDGTAKAHGRQGPNPRTHQIDPAVDGHIVLVQWDAHSEYLGLGFKFFLSGGKVITVDGEACRWRKGQIPPGKCLADWSHTHSWREPSPKAYALLDFTLADGVNENGRPIPTGGVWQELPP